MHKDFAATSGHGRLLFSHANDQPDARTSWELKPTSYIANFDSAAAMLRALANYLRGRDFPLLGTGTNRREPFLAPVAALVNALPRVLREQVYIWSGRFEAIRPGKLSQAKLDRVCQWAASLYPKRRYPAAAVGSSNGAAIHLFAALGIPWLPQTFLVPVACSEVDVDEPEQAIEWAREPAKVFLQANPDWELHHMHDPNQDRLMLHRMTYFRAKRLRLGAAYERFLAERLEADGTIFTIECNLQWPTTRLADRHIFQFGALGGVTPKELFNGGPRVMEFLAAEKSHRQKWSPPAPNKDRPEAEWGFAIPLRDDIERFARQHGFRVRRIVFDEPESLSPVIADLYSWWNQLRGIRQERLMIESFIVMEPYWTICTGSVPFWMVFNKEPSARALEAYLSARGAFDEIYMMLFSHGVNSIGLVPIARWEQFLRQARRRGEFIGVDPSAYPRDFAVFVRYHRQLSRLISAREPIPSPLSLADLDEFLRQNSDRHAVQWL